MLGTLQPKFQRYHRMITVLLQGFSSGLPLALTGTALQAWFTQAGVDIVTIGLLALVGQPYIYKFVWAPLMDRYAIPGLGRRRGWMLLTQIALIISISIMACLSPIEHTATLAFVALFTAFLSASQDTAIDAYRVDLLPIEERGLGVAMSVAGYRTAMFASGSLSLIFAAYWGWQVTYIIMAGLMLVGIVATFFSPILESDVPPQTLRQAIVEPWREFISREKALLVLVLILFYKLAEAFTSTWGPLTNTFLLRGIGFDLVTVATVNKGMGLLANILGVFAGGLLLTRMSLYRSLLLFGIAQVLANLTFLMLALVGKQLNVLILAVSIDNFTSGMGTAAVIALIMSLCHPRYSATQFALLSAVAALPRVVVGPLGALIVKFASWVSLFIWASILALPALGILYLLREQVKGLATAP